MDGQDEKTLVFRISGLREGKPFPIAHTGRGEDISPGFILENLSLEAQTLAIVLEDLSHPIRNFTHWIIWNIPAMDTVPHALPAGKRVPQLGGAVQGMAYGLHRYAGPKPPKGKRHDYRFTVCVLDTELRLGPGAGKRAFLRAAEGHILQQGSMCSYFQ